MKKLLLLLFALCTACACTTPEEDAQIKLFWTEQVMQLVFERAMPGSAPLPPFPAIPPEETLQEPPAESLPAQEAAAQTPAADTQTPQDPAANLPPAQDPVAPGLQAPQPAAAAKPSKPRHSEQQFIEITLEDSARVNKLKSNAPLKDRQAMQRAIERVKQSNQQTVQDIGSMFGGDTQAQAFAIVSKSEKILLRTANVSNTYQNYLNAQQKILQEQEQLLNQLMRANAYKLSRTRG